MKKLIQWIRWNILSLMPYPDSGSSQYRSCYSEDSEIDSGYEVYCADCDMVNYFNRQGLVDRWRERLGWRNERKIREKKIQEKELRDSLIYDPFEEN